MPFSFSAAASSCFVVLVVGLVLVATTTVTAYTSPTPEPESPTPEPETNYCNVCGANTPLPVIDIDFMMGKESKACTEYPGSLIQGSGHRCGDVTCESRYAKGTWKKTSKDATHFFNKKFGPYAYKDVSKKICAALPAGCRLTKKVLEKIPGVDEILDIMEWVHKSELPDLCHCEEKQDYCYDTLGECILEKFHFCDDDNNVCLPEKEAAVDFAKGPEDCIPNPNGAGCVKVIKTTSNWAGCAFNGLSYCGGRCNANDLGCIKCWGDPDGDGNLHGTSAQIVCIPPGGLAGRPWWYGQAAWDCNYFCQYDQSNARRGDEGGCTNIRGRNYTSPLH